MKAENPKIIETIKKVLALASDSANENEAQAAALKAQELLAKYHISMTDIDMQDNDIDEIYVEVGEGKKWKYQLAAIVAKNFCCKMFMYGHDTIVFYGHPTDIRIATNVFQTLFYTGNKLGKEKYHEIKARYGTGQGVFNSFVSGFCAGLASVLDKQCTALMIVVPTDVENAFKERSEKFKKSTIHHVRTQYSDIYNDGFNEGVSAMQSRQIERKEVV